MCAIPAEDAIRTERLKLSAPRFEDAVHIAGLADPDIARMTTAFPYPYRLGDAAAFLARMSKAGGDDVPLLIEHLDFGPIGMLGFHRHARTGLMELGYWLGRTFRGRGFATEAARGALGWAERAIGVRAVVSGHFEDNPQSGRVLAKAGFLYSGAVETRFSLGRGCAVRTRMMVRLS